ncbi:MAG TPA: HAD family phosphatase [Jiangellaceae bacterium]|nr:HAD family phosphatase [Jiangellaceae bacterium]
MAALPAAVLWDLDGTLVDTEPSWNAAQHRLIASYGGTWSEEHALQVVGSDLLDSAHYIKAVGGIPLEPEQIVARLVSEVLSVLHTEITWRPGARELLTALRARDVPCALVTMSYRVLAEAVVAALPAGTFATTVTGDEVEHGKPHPEPYLTAARSLGVAPERCVVIEDSVTGSTSGAAAGAMVLAVPNAVAVPAATRILVRSSLVGVSPADLGDLVA